MMHKGGAWVYHHETAQDPKFAPDQVPDRELSEMVGRVKALGSPQVIDALMAWSESLLRFNETVRRHGDGSPQVVAMAGEMRQRELDARTLVRQELRSDRA